MLSQLCPDEQVSFSFHFLFHHGLRFLHCSLLALPGFQEVPYNFNADTKKTLGDFNWHRNAADQPWPISIGIEIWQVNYVQFRLAAETGPNTMVSEFWCPNSYIGAHALDPDGTVYNPMNELRI